jgi:hypothetical protein
MTRQPSPPSWHRGGSGQHKKGRGWDHGHLPGPGRPLCQPLGCQGLIRTNGGRQCAGSLWCVTCLSPK